MANKNPNIILIVLDTLRPDHLSCYGYPKPTSPNLDRIAAEGAVFEQAYSTAPWTLPSHASMFTGTFVSRHGLDTGQEKLAEHFVTLAEFLQRAGYFTASFSSNIWVSEFTGLARGFEYFRNAKEIPYQSVKQLSLYQKVVKEIYLRYFFKRYDYGAREINGMLKEFFRRRWQPARPFFVFVNYLETHLQYRPPRKFRNLFLDEMQRRRAKHVNQNAPRFNADMVSMTDEDFEVLRALYDAEIRYVDHRLGQFISMLRDLKILDDTLLIITSDHGENLGEHGLMDHQYSLHDTLIHIPLIVRFPEAFAGGSRIDAPVQTTDFLPTVSELLDAEPDALPSEQRQGESFLNLSTKRKERDVFAEYLNPRVEVLERLAPGGDWSAFNAKLRAIRTARFKFIQSSDGQDKLYDLTVDPQENNNLVAQLPAMADTLGQKLTDWQKSLNKNTERSQFEITGDVRRVLEGLGYI